MMKNIFIMTENRPSVGKVIPVSANPCKYVILRNKCEMLSEPKSTLSFLRGNIIEIFFCFLFVLFNK